MRERERAVGHLSSNRCLSSRAAATEQGVTSRPLPSPIPCRVQSSAAGTHPGKHQNQITPFLRRLHVLQGLHQLASGEFVASPRSSTPISPYDSLSCVLSRCPVEIFIWPRLFSGLPRSSCFTRCYFRFYTIETNFCYRFQQESVRY